MLVLVFLKEVKDSSPNEVDFTGNTLHKTNQMSTTSQRHRQSTPCCRDHPLFTPAPNQPSTRPTSHDDDSKWPMLEPTELNREPLPPSVSDLDQLGRKGTLVSHWPISWRRQKVQSAWGIFFAKNRNGHFRVASLEHF
jgi:hypothetical protein